MQILQLHYAFSSRWAGGKWDAAGSRSVGSFFGFLRRGACRIRAAGAGMSLTDVIFRDLGQTRSLGSFGCGVFAGGALAERPSFPASVESEMV